MLKKKNPRKYRDKLIVDRLLSKNLYGIISLILILSVLVGCSGFKRNKVNEPSLERTTYALGTVIQLNLFDQGDEALMNQLIERINEIDSLMSAKREDSEVAKIALMAGIEPVKVSDETYEVIKKALEYARVSDGKFDPTVGPIVELWGIGTEEAKVPSEDDITKGLALVDYSKVVLNDLEQSIYLPIAGMSIDLGGIAKGYATDEVARLLKEAGITKAMISLGGNIYAHGEKEQDIFWKIGIQNPFDQRNQYFGYVEVKDQTVVTSGPYERYFEDNGQIYHHIFDAKTGYPVITETTSISIVADYSIDADALSTLLFTMEIKEGIALIESMDGIDCIYVNEQFEVQTSNGIRGNVIITDEKYSMIN